MLAIIGSGAADSPPLICFGNEPSWSVELTAPGLARVARPDRAPAEYRGSETRLPSLRERVWRGTSAAGDLVAFLSEATCSDGMSDRRHPVTARVSLPDGQFLVGCCRVAVAATASPAHLEGITWRLIELPGQDPAVVGSLEQRVTSRFDAGQVAGFGGCNRYRGTYRIEGDRVTVGPLAGTMMACPDPSMAIESAFKAALAGSLRYAVTGDRLSLTSASGATVVFAVEPPPTLEGRVWDVTGLNNGRKAVVSPIVGTALTLTFREGAASGHAGCNTFRATYSSEAGRVVIGPVASTRKQCPGAAVMDQEREFLAALGSAVVWSVDGDVLDMHRADGERAIIARAKTK